MKKTTRMITALLALTFAASAEEQTKPTKPIPRQEIVEAALGGNLAPIEKALAQGYKTDTPDAEGRTLLMYPAFNGRTNVIGKLLDSGADVNAQDKTGSIALMFAARNGHTAVVKILQAAADKTQKGPAE